MDDKEFEIEINENINLENTEEENIKEKKERKPRKKKKSSDTQEATIVPVEQTLSNKIPLIPLSGRPIFPGVFTPLIINSTEDVKVAEQSYGDEGLIGLVMLK